ncbi:unc-22 [Cordylochernes scorpioides]|uniref:Unc-22 n=1 Tax=Cordylochernes scorpioides TaxID=51811 RepID=A0ABY6KB46_9ARAC|nr:unc-22 [Cordylochernes scorpioides]
MESGIALDIPGEPGKAEIADYDTDFVKLKWDPPTRDGGSPVVGYVVEKKDRFSDEWVPAGECSGTSKEIKGLIQGEKYEFRVRAMNKAGVGPPGDSCSPHVARPKNAKPRIDRTNLKEVIVKCGHAVNFDINVEGEPVPEVKWLYKEQELQSSENLRIDNVDYNTKFFIMRATRKDSGKYTIVASNRNGKDTAEVEVVVMGKPGKPKGPLAVENVHKDGCDLKWGKPEDDGGLPIDGYEIEKYDEEREAWVPAGKSTEPSFHVGNLTPGHKYKFRVRAVNKEGDSEELETEQAIEAKNPYDEPSKPGRPEITDWDKDHIDLKWAAPSSDGGSPISGYIIEKKKKSSHKWAKAKEVKGDTTAASVFDMEEGEEYEFRVIAVNEGGNSEPSDPSRSQVAKPRHLAPKIDRTNLNDVTIKAGQPVKFDVDVQGEPAPQITWLFGETILKNTDKTQITTEDYHTLFILAKTKRADTGKYTITAKNDSGEDSVTINITILGKPSKPKGPLEVKDVTERGCVLNWNPPEDDGGKPLEHYVIEKMDTDTGRWVQHAVTKDPTAEIAGLIPGKDYKFRVKAVNAEGESEPLETDKSILAKNPYDEPGRPGKPSVKDWDKHHVDLAWKAPDSDGGAPISSYIIEKKDQFSSKWQKAAEVIGDKCEARVSDLAEGMQYQFRVVAVNPAGPGAASEPSDAVTAKARHVPPKIDRSTLSDMTIHAGQSLRFEVKVTGEPVPSKVWSHNGTALKDGGQISIETEPHKIKLVLHNVERKNTGSYTLKAENNCGSDKAEVKITVLDKPAAPEGPLEVSDVHAEGCKLKWNPPKDDGGVPVQDYLVEKQDTATGRWVPVGRSTEPEMEVTNLDPGQEVKFRVRAVNPEGESDPLEAEKPIVAKNPFDAPGAPEAPQVRDWDKDHVDLIWDPPSKNGGSPVLGYIVEKKGKDSLEWEKALKLDEPVCQAKVTGLPTGETFQFRIRAVNAAGPGDPSEATKPVVVKPRRLPPRINRRTLKNITVKTGQAFTMEAKITGEPAPDVTWKLKDRMVTERPTLTIENVPYHTKLSCERAERSDAGIYWIIATNRHGEDSAEVEVQVLAKPSKPEGPLEVKDVNKNGCKLEWAKPLDDGGVPLEGYLVEKLDPDTGLWMPVTKTTTPQAEVTGLTPGKAYKFRIKALNKEGESEPLETLMPIVAKDPYEVPGSPDKVEIEDWSKDHVDLKWKAPLKDGGAPISHYIIEKKEKNATKWEKVAETPGDQCKGTAPFLTEGKEYEFRVIAVNKAGPGEPSEASKSIVAKLRYLAPMIDRSTLKDLILKVGQSIKFDVDVIGEPPPTITWCLEDRTLDSNDRINIENVDYNTKVSIRKTTRADSGIYTITASNSSGKDSATIKVILKDKPTPPKGPLEVADVHKEGCKLKWQPPQDDGGMPLDGYTVEKMDTDSGVWIPVGTTKDSGMEVTGLAPGKNYKFRVRAVNKEGESEPLEADKAITAKNPFDEPGQPGTPEAMDWDKDHVELKWTPPASDGGSPVTSYIVEKKDKWGNWEKAAEVPGNKTEASINDLPSNETFEFRVRAVNKAGPGEPSGASLPIVTKPRRLPPKIDRTNLHKIRVKAGQSFTFDVDIVGEPVPKEEWALEGRVLSSSDHCRITSEPYHTKLHVKKATRNDCGIYMLTATNQHGKDQAEVEVVVLDKPSHPGGPLKIEDVHDEGCTLSWKPPQDDGGAPVDHYVVEKLDPTTGIWTPAADTIGPETSAKVKGLQPGHQYKFRVRAVNRQGESEPLEAEKTIVAKNPYDAPGQPTAPAIEDYDHDFVKLGWKPPATDGGSPITGYIVEKKDKNDLDWVPVQEVAGTATTATVPNLLEGNQYEFRIRAVNKAGPGTPSDSSGMHTVRYKNLAPKIDRNAMHNIRVKAGRTFELDVGVSGEPPATKTWTLNGVPMDTQLRWGITNEPYRTKLVVKEAERADSGTLLLTATNANGKDSAQVTVNILDVPSAPESLSISNVTKEGCQLSWQAPHDDGGSEIQQYVVEKRDSETGRWLPVGTALGTSLHADNLLENHDYTFRVKAVNREGSSPWLVARESVVAKNPFDVPDKPGAPKVVDWDSNHMDLEWQAPRKDNGAPVTTYVIEKHVKGSPIWEEALRIPGDMTKARIPDLREGEEYEFRVVAINKAGPSDPSDGSAPMVAKPRHLAPTLEKSVMQDLKVRVGRTISYTIPIGGEPAPAPTWYINDKTTLAMPRVETEASAAVACLHITSSQRSDSGRYTLCLENPSGKTSCSANVIVMDRPSPPVGPLEVTDVTRESALLQWRLPLDDGGSPIRHYIIEKMDISRGTWVEAGTSLSLSHKVTRLVHNKSYQFRVMASNDIGDSDPLEKAEAVVARNPLEPPSSPGKPKLKDWDRDHVDLEWEAPADSGGDPISGYIIQKKEKGGHWVKALDVPADKTSASVPGLTDGADYEFRVIAVNKGGPSEPSLPSDMVTCKPRFLAPKILTPMKELPVKIGQILHFEIKFEGEPAPEVAWTLNNAPLTSNEKFTVSMGDDNTTIHKVNVNKADCGPFTLTLTNSSGKDTGTMTVVLLDKPGRPEGPLEVNDIDKDHVVLAWNKPKESGGSPITGYVIEKRDKTHGGGWVPAVIPHVPANTTSCTVPRLVEGTSYEFRVRAVNDQGVSEPLETDRAIVAKSPYHVPSCPGQPEAVDHDKDFIKLKWSPPRSDGGSPITGYDVERRDLKTNRWVKINREPLKGPQYTDNTVIDGHMYEYRVVALNAAGQSEPSVASKPIAAKPMKEKPKLHLDGLYGRMIRVRAGDPLHITVPLTGAPPPTITWKFDGKIIPPSNRVQTECVEEFCSLTIPNSLRSDTGRFTISALNPYGDDSADITVLVYDKPSPPKALEYLETTSTTISMRWTKPDDDGGSEIMGYIVERCELGSDKWIPVGGYCPGTSCIAKNLEPNKKYNFRIRAENMYGISDPLMGKTVIAKNPFDTPGAPGQPKIEDFGPTLVTLSWTPPANDGGRPITGYLVERREKGSMEWMRATNFPTTETEFTATNLSEGHTYEFRVLAVNEGGPGKPSRSSQYVTAREKKFAPEAPDAPKIDAITKSSVTLSWNKPMDGGSKITGYLLEKRRKGDPEWDIVNPLSHPDTSYTVANLDEGQEYEFRVMAQNDIGESPPSKPSSLVRVEDQPDKPRIDAGKVKDITVKAGDEFEIYVPFSAFPKPTATWSIGNKEIEETHPHYFTRLGDDYAILAVNKAERDDTAKYKLYLKNKSGFDSCYCNVTVLDRPSPPQHLRADEVEGDSLTLNWQPPLDNGGAEVSNYVVERREKGTSTWTRVTSFVAGTACRVRNLLVNHSYEFRVMAENSYGTSDPATMAEPLLVKLPFGPPGTPDAVETTESSITLSWTKPRQDGGSAITGYILERRKAGEDKWTKVTPSPVPDLTCKAIGLVENTEYEFRVAAINAAGQGPYSSSSDSIKAQKPRLNLAASPKIDASFTMRDQVVVAGDEFTIRVPHSGFPVPTASWTINGEALVPQNRVVTEINVAFSLFLNKKATRKDTGIYCLKLANREGSDSASCRITVVDVPGIPQGPLEVSDVTPDTCSLSWRPPQDDGGSPITNYVVEKQDPSTKIWSKLSGYVRGCHYDVMGLDAGKHYHFRVSAENKYGVGPSLETDVPIIARFPFDVPSPPGQPNIVDWDSSTASLTWDRPVHDGGSKIQGYQIEYRDPMDGTYRVANDFLVKDLEFTVSGLQEEHEYEFRIRAKNAAGFSNPSTPSSLLKIKKKFNVPSPPQNLKVVKVGKSYVDLKWEKPKSDGGSRITGYIVERREASSHLWFKANEYNVVDCEYCALNLSENSSYEFRVCAVNAAGRSEFCAATSPVKVTEYTGGIKPEFVRKLMKRNTSLKKSVTLECEAVGKPSPTARWFKNGHEVLPVGRVSMQDKEDGIYKLTISEIWESDEGEYSCEITNPLGGDKCAAMLYVAAPPRIEQCPTDVTFPEHENGKIKVYFSGTGPFEVMLFKEGIETQSDDHLKFTVFDDYVILFFRDVLRSDEGKYKITVSNLSGTADADFTIAVTGLPGPPQGPLNVTDITNHSCSLSWQPPAYDNGSKVTHYIVERKETDVGHWVIASSYCKTMGSTSAHPQETTMDVQGLTENNEYLFRVMAVNENGQSEPLVGANPIKARLPYDPPSAPGIPKVTEVGGDFVNLTWTKPESDGGNRIRGYWVEKRELGTETWQRTSHHLSITTQTNILALIEDRQYEFRVCAVNDAGPGPYSITERPVRIKDPLAAEPPEFTTPLKDVMAMENKRAEFTCTVVGNPTPRITWYKGVRELFEGGKFSFLKDGDQQILAISEVYGEDADEYTCRAVNKGGSKTSRAELIIKSPPRINVPPRFRDTACFEKGENVVLKIPFTGFPKPRFKWYRDNEEIERGGHYDIKVADRHVILTIHDVTFMDSAPYRLQAENELGTDSAIIRVQISDRPDPPRFPAVESVREDNVILTWQPPLWDGGSSITSYLLEKQEAPMSSTWIRCGHTRFLTHQITGLNPGKEYCFRVSAENVYGRSDPSPATQPITTKLDAAGRRIRGKSEGKVFNYDQYVFDIDKYPAQPVDIKTSSVYDFYDVLEEIGVGSFGFVHRCREKRTGHIFAAKFIPVSNLLEKSIVKKEIDIMNQLHHNKLIRLQDAFEDDDEMVMIYEFMAGGELYERISDGGYKMSEAEVIQYMRQLCEALKHMHEKNICHLDLKPEMIMCQAKNSNTIKIIDFSMATKIDPRESVRLSTQDAEFAAPEIADREPVGFYTDMWSVGIIAYNLLSGISPFLGANDKETTKNVRACQWSFDEEAFKGISEEGKDFIRKLLLRNKEKRLTAHECLEHPWLKGDIKESPSIPNKRYHGIRDRMRARYPDHWDSALLPMGHISNYSSLCKLHEERYKIFDFYFDRRQAAPRFVIRPQSTFAYEGQSAKFYCRVIAVAPPTLTWYRDNMELKLSVKYMKRYQENDYYFFINRCKVDDRGEYIIRAENAYGYREEPVFLNVQAVPHDIPHVKLDEPVRTRMPYKYKLWQEPPDSAPCFTFHLRHRLIQTGLGVKLLCCLSGKPTPEVKWFKDGKELSKFEYAMSHADGVVTLEIPGVTKEDAGKYSCIATNSLGQDETNCQIMVEERKVPSTGKSAILVAPTGVSSATTTSSSLHTESTDTYHRDYHRYSTKSSDHSYSSSSYTSKASSYHSSRLSTDYLTATSARYSSPSRYSSRLSPAPTSRYSPAPASSRYSPAAAVPAKRTQKPYGAKKDSTGTTPRSRSATKELESKHILFFPMYISPVRLAVPEDKQMLAPQFTQKLADLKVKDGEALLLKCQVQGDPEPQVEWYKNGELLRSSDIVDLKYKNGVASLSIGEVYPEDEGEYLCKATSSLGSVSTRCKLAILPMDTAEAAVKAGVKPPRITQHLKSQVINDGDPVTLECIIKGPSKFDVVWLHNDKEIKSSKDFQYRNEGERYQLNIAEIYPEDAGIYTCEAFNDVGEAFSSCNLVVNGKCCCSPLPGARVSPEWIAVPSEKLPGPGFSQFPQSQTVHQGQSASFTASAGADIKNVAWMKDGAPLDVASGRFTTTQDGRNVSLSLAKPLVADIGQYTLKLKDSAGAESSATFSLNVLADTDL